MSTTRENVGVFYYEQTEAGKRGTCYQAENITNVHLIKTNPESKKGLEGRIIDMIDDTCRNLVDVDYVRRQMSKNTIIMLFYVSSKPIGFVLASIHHEDSEYYIDVICSKRGYGKDLLDFCFNDAGRRNLKSIGLSALPHVLGYYSKFGFTHRRSCDDGGLVLPEKLAIRKHTEPPLSPDDVYDDDELADYMVQLTSLGYGDDQSEPCQQRPLTKKNLKDGKCGKNGFYMKKCFYPDVHHRV
jgi:hypothetical protein